MNSNSSKIKRFLFSINYLQPEETEEVYKEFSLNSFKLGWQASIAVVLLHALAQNSLPNASIFISAEIIVVLSTVLLDITSFQFRKLLHSKDKQNWLILNLSLRFTFYLSLSYILANYIESFGLVSLIGVISVGIIAAGAESIVHHAFPFPSYGLFLIFSYVSMPLYALYHDKAPGSIIFFIMSIIHFSFHLPKIIARNKMFFDKLAAKFQVHKEKEQFEILYDMIPAAVCWLKHDLTYIRANHYVSGYAGRTKQSFVGNKFGFTQDIKEQNEIDNFIESDRTEFTKNFVFKRTDGISRRHQTFWKKIKNKTEIVVLCVDVEDQLKSQELNEVLLSRINVLMASSKIGILFLDLRSHSIEISEEFSLITNIKMNRAYSILDENENPSYLKSISYCKEDSQAPDTQLNFILDSIASKMDQESVLQFKSKFIQLMNGSSKTLNFECSFHNADRGWIWVNMFFTIEKYDEQNRPLSIIGYFTDWTQKKEMEISLAQSTKMVTLGHMASGIAHEIDSPLAVISGKVRGLKKQIETNNFNPDLALIDIEKLESMVSRIIKIIKGLKAISKEEATEELEHVSIKHIVDETASISYTRFLQSDIDLTIGPIPEDYKINCKSVQISQVLLNLLNNSYDAIKDDIKKKWVTVELVESKNHYFIYVTDSGNGIPVELHNKILNPFFTTKETDKGNGLGLSISQSIMFEHKGEIGIDKSCKNTRFYLQFPKPNN